MTKPTLRIEKNLYQSHFGYLLIYIIHMVKELWRTELSCVTYLTDGLMPYQPEFPTSIRKSLILFTFYAVTRLPVCVTILTGTKKIAICLIRHKWRQVAIN